MRAPAGQSWVLPCGLRAVATASPTCSGISRTKLSAMAASLSTMTGYARAPTPAIVTARKPGAKPMSAADPALDAWRGLVDLDRLTGWMDDRGLERGPIEEAARPPGGTQNIL